MKKLQIAICAASLAVAMSASANITYDNTIAPIVGSGNSSTGWTSANNTDLGLTLSLRAQDRGLPNTPNNGAGTFTFPVGQQWDVWFDVNSGSSPTSDYTYALTIHSSLGGPDQTMLTTLGQSIAYIGDNGVSGNEFQNAEWLGFTWNNFTGYDMSLQATYNFTLDAKDGNGNSVDSVNMTVINNGTTPVPEPTTIISGALLLLPFGAGVARKLCKKHTA